MRHSAYLSRRVLHLTLLWNLLFVSCAGADWQYTKWGMTPEQVVRASKGAAVTNTDRMLDAGEIRTQLVAPYQSQGFAFRASFMFGPDNKLRSVQLALQNASCPALVGSLTNTYGPQQSKSRSSIVKFDRWWDQKNGNDVVYSEIGSSCFVQYGPLAMPGKPGGL